MLNISIQGKLQKKNWTGEDQNQVAKMHHCGRFGRSCGSHFHRPKSTQLLSPSHGPHFRNSFHFILCPKYKQNTQAPNFCFLVPGRSVNGHETADTCAGEMPKLSLPERIYLRVRSFYCFVLLELLELCRWWKNNW